MDNIYRLSGSDLDYLIAVAKTAQENGQALSVAIDGGVKIKRGESMWTPPLGRPMIRVR